MKISELSKTSIALKFLIEYISSRPANIGKSLGFLEYEKILATCSQIINWAFDGDLFYYNVINEDIEMLESNRLGIDHSAIKKLEKLNIEAHNKVYINAYKVRFSEEFSNYLYNKFSDKLDEAFFEEYTISFIEYTLCIKLLILYGENITSNVKVAQKNNILDFALKEKIEVSEETFNTFIDKFSLKEREDYLKPPKPYKKEDVYPWRFNNRPLSFIRKPIICQNNKIIWGNRQLFHSWLFLHQCIFNGDLKVNSNKFKVLLGKISNEIGSEFNKQVYSKIKSLDDNFIVKQNLKKITKQKIVDKQNNPLGDIDVLLIIPNLKKIISIEVKNFKISKTFYEIQMEYESIFIDKNNKKSYVTKHNNRTEWLKNHINDLIEEYNLKGHNWDIRSLFIVNEPIISNEFYNKNIKFITYNELNKEPIISNEFYNKNIKFITYNELNKSNILEV